MPRILCLETNGYRSTLHATKGAIEELVSNKLVYHESGEALSKEAVYMPVANVIDECSEDKIMVLDAMSMYVGKENITKIEFGMIPHHRPQPIVLKPELTPQGKSEFDVHDLVVLHDALCASMVVEWNRMRSELHDEKSQWYINARAKYDKYEALANRIVNIRKERE